MNLTPATPQEPRAPEAKPTCTCENGGTVIAWNVNGKIETSRAYDADCPVHGLQSLLK